MNTSMQTDIPWTQEFLDWLPWVATIDETDVTTDQRTAVDAVLGQRAGSAYYEVLAHDLESVRTRTVLFGDIFEGQPGTPRQDRELAATATSRVNGCVYCASVHARLYANLSKQREQMQRLLDEGVDTELPDRERAIVDLSVKLTRDPELLTGSDLQPLRDQELDDVAILDIVQASAIFGNANRLMLGLGQPRRKGAIAT